MSTANATSSQPVPSHAYMKEIIAKHIEKLTLSFEETVNTRNFDLSSPGWQIYAKEFIDDSPSMQRPKTIKLEELKQQMMAAADEFPEYRVRFLDLSTTVNDKLDRATCFFRTELTGLPVGVTKQGMSTVEFRLKGEDAKWYCVRQTNIAGEDYVGV